MSSETSINNMESDSRNISAFDWLRVIGCFMVILWHSGALNIIAINQTLTKLRDIISFNILLVAVPIFVQISLLLFFKKRDFSTNYFMSKRLPRLIKLYAFWLTVRLLFYKAVGISIADFFDDFPSVLTTLISGANSEVYFMFALIFSTTISELFIRLMSRLKPQARIVWIRGLLFVSCLIIVLLSAVAVLTEKGELCIWWNPINFLPYTFSSMILYNDFNRNEIIFSHPRIRCKLFFFSFIWLLSSALEWSFLNRPDIFGFALPQYSRISSVFASLLLIYTALLIFRHTPVWVKQISTKSSAIYFIHRYFINRYSIGMLQDLIPAFSSIASVIVFVFGAITSFAIAHLMQRIKALRFAT